MAKVKTVNVVEMADDDLLGVSSFSDDTEGNQEAESHFRAVILENGVAEEDVESFIEDGYYEQGTYQAFITHS